MFPLREMHLNSEPFGLRAGLEAIFTKKNAKNRFHKFLALKYLNGGSDGIRTRDLCRDRAAF